MPTILSLLLSAVLPSLRDRASLQLELIALRHQLAVLERRRTTRPRLTRIDRFFWVWLYRLWPGCLDIVVIVKPDTVIGWHRMGFRLFWAWRSRPRRRGRPRVPQEVRALIRRMSRENPLWGAPRIHGELLMLGIEISQATVSKHMSAIAARRHRPGGPSLPTMRTVSPRSICSSSRLLPFECSMPSLCCAMNGAGSFISTSRPIRQRPGSGNSLWKRFRGKPGRNA